MAKGVVGTDYEVMFTIRQTDGLIATGVAPGDVTPRVRHLPGGTDDGSVAAITEIGNGRYQMIIRAAFSTSEGVGNYGWSAEVVSASPLVQDIISGIVEFHVDDIDDTAADIAALNDFDPAATPVEILSTGGTAGGHAADELVDDVWDEDIVAAHGTADTAGLILRALGAAISQRANNATLNALLGFADSPGVSNESRLQEIEADIAALNDLSALQVENAVWDAATASHVGAGTFGALIGTNLNATVSSRSSHSASDVWGISVPGAFGAGTAGFILGTNLDLPITDIETDIAALNDLSALQVENAVWDATTAAHVTPGTFGAVLGPGGLTDWTTAEKEQIRFRLSLDGTQTDPVTALGTMETLLSEHASTQADIAALNDLSQADVWDYDLTANYAVTAGSVDAAGEMLKLQRMQITNAYDFASGDPDGSAILYADGEVSGGTAALTWTQNDEDGNKVNKSFFQPARRGIAA